MGRRIETLSAAPRVKIENDPGSCGGLLSFWPASPICSTPRRCGAKRAAIDFRPFAVYIE